MTKSQIESRIKELEEWLNDHPDASVIGEELAELRDELRAGSAGRNTPL